MTINFYINIDPKSNPKECRIYCYIRGIQKGKTFSIFTGEKIDPKYWDATKQKSKGGWSDYKNFNLRIESYQDAIKKMANDIILADPFTTHEDFKTKLLNKINRIDELDVYQLMDRFINAPTNRLGKFRATSTLSNLKQVQRHFIDYTQGKALISNINKAWFDKYFQHLVTVIGLTDASANQQLLNLKSFFYWCYENGFSKNNIHEKIKIVKPKDASEILFLTKDELFRIINLKLDNEALERARDLFLLECFTAQRYSDLQRLKHNDIVTIGADKFLKIFNQKTSKHVEIPLHPLAMQILDKYIAKGEKFPKLQLSKLNIHIKKLGELASIDFPYEIISYQMGVRIVKQVKKFEKMSSHTGRRTFISLWLQDNKPISVLMQITNHSEIKTLQKYVGKDANITKQYMDDFLNADIGE